MKLAARITKLERSPALQPSIQPCPGCGMLPRGVGPPTWWPVEVALAWQLRVGQPTPARGARDRPAHRAQERALC